MSRLINFLIYLRQNKLCRLYFILFQLLLFMWFCFAYPAYQLVVDIKSLLGFEFETKEQFKLAGQVALAGYHSAFVLFAYYSFKRYLAATRIKL